MAKKIAIAADHGGYALKEALKKVLKKRRYQIIDVGTGSEDPCDYPEYGFKAAQLVSDKKAAKAVLICKSGIGMSIIANKLPGVRAALCSSESDAISSRKHNHANVLVLAASKTTSGEAEKILKAWLSTRVLKGRHARRVSMISDYEKRIRKSTGRRR